MGVKQRTHSYNESQTENIVGIMGVNQRTCSYNESWTNYAYWWIIMAMLPAAAVQYSTSRHTYRWYSLVANSQLGDCTRSVDFRLLSLHTRTVLIVYTIQVTEQSCKIERAVKTQQHIRKTKRRKREKQTKNNNNKLPLNDAAVHTD